MNRHSSDGPASSVPSMSKKAPAISEFKPAPVIVSPGSPLHFAQEAFFQPREDSAAPPTPPAPRARCKKLRPRRPEFAQSAKANNARPPLTNSRASVPPAPAIPDNKNTRTSKSHKPRDSHAKPPAHDPTTFPASNDFRTRSAPRAPPTREENQSPYHAQKIKSVAKAKSTPPPRKT